MSILSVALSLKSIASEYYFIQPFQTYQEDEAIAAGITVNSIILKQDMTTEAIEAMFLRDDEAYDLTDASVQFRMFARGTDKIDKQADIKGDADTGVAWVVLEAANVDTAGIYRGEYKVTHTDGRTAIFPTEGYIDIYIEPRIGG